MSKRNFILLIIILIIVVAGVFVFFYFQQQGTTPGDNTPGTNFLSQFNPFGKSTPKPSNNNNTQTPPVDISNNQPAPEPEVNVKLKKVSSMPIAGFVVYSKERLKEINPTPALPLSGDGDISAPPADPATKTTSKKTAKPVAPLTEFMPALRYVDRAMGGIYETFADKIEELKFSETVIPKVYEAYFGNGGNSVVMRYLNDDGRTIETFVGNIPKEYLGADTIPDNKVTGTFLPENVRDVSVSPDAKSIFYLFDSGDSLVGTTLNLTTNKKVQIFDSPFTEWLSLWPNSKLVTFTTKPSAGIPGYMYALDPTNVKILSKALGDINGLTTLTSPSGKLVLYSNDNLSLGIYHLDTKTLNSLGVNTLPEKCVWGKLSDVIYCAVPKIIDPGLYPDAWYQGVVSFSDQLWKIDVKTGNATMLLDPLTVSRGEEIDGTKLALDDGENYLFFVNKKDSFLWEFALK